MPPVSGTHKSGGSLQELTKRPEWIDFIPSQLVALDRDKYSELLGRVEESLLSGTNKEKGDSLEELADFLLSSIKAFIVGQKTNTSTGELDRFLKISKIPGTFLCDWSLYIPVECKNWNDPVGGDIIDHLYAKARNMDANRGILFSREGVTGNMSHDGWRQIVNLFQNSRYITIVVDIDDLRSINAGTCPLHIIEQCQEKVILSA